MRSATRGSAESALQRRHSGRHKDKTITLLGVDGNAIINSRVIIQELHSNAADSLHVFLARASDCDFFLSADEELVLLVIFGKLRIDSIYVHSIADMQWFFSGI